MLVIGLPALLIAVASLRRLPRAVVGPAVVAAALVLPAAAHAGTYTTVSCGDPDTHRMTGRSGSPPGWGADEYQPGSGNWETPATCDRWASDNGFGLMTNPIGGAVPYPQWGRLRFVPPPDTTVAGARVARALRRPNPSPFAVPMLATSPVDWCHVYWSDCTVGNIANPRDPANIAELGSSLWFELLCDGSQGCARDGWALWKVFGARITLNDGYAPAFAGAPAMSASGSSLSVTVAGSDRGGGLLRGELLAGDRVLTSASFDSNGRCDTGFHPDLVPCPLSATRTLLADTRTVPDGDYELRARLTDVAGNTTTYSLGRKVIANAPDPPRLQSRDAWLDAQEASVYGVAITAPAARPPAGIAGYAVSYDGTEPGTDATVRADAGGNAVFGPPPGGWRDGTVVIKARTVAADGPVSKASGQARIRVDSTAPTLAVSGAGNGTDWLPAPVTLSLGARDAGSGMGGAEDGQPVESGGHIAYELDGLPPRRVAGDEAAVLANGLGTHSLTARAYDAAGNVSGDRTVTFQVGRPESALSDPNFGFWARTANPGTTFTAAASFGAACPAEVTLTPSRDTYVDEARPDASFGSASGLALRSNGGANARALLAFDLPAPAGCRVAAAQLRVHATAASAGRTLQAFRAGGSWDDDTTWATRPGVAGTPATASSGPGWVALDVTAQVQGIYDHGDDGLLLRDAAEGAAQSAGQAYGSREGVPAERPQLTVGFG
jgi:hypothetical protein